jgi:iron complex transport system substrate-binding protein
MGLRTAAVLGTALALAAAAAAAGSTPPLQAASSYLVSAQQPDGGFAEAGRQPDVSLTAWAALGLVAGRASADSRAGALSYLRAHERDAQQINDVALEVLARVALGDRPEMLLDRLRAVRPGGLLNEESWTILALRGAGDPAPPALVADLLATQSRSGGWSWTRRGAPDSNDTAAAIEALRAAGISGKPIMRALAALRGFQNSDGGYGLVRGRESDAQSTAWVVQAQLAAGTKPPPSCWRLLARLRRRDGSYRYSVRYGTTPVWVTSQVVPALAGRPYPLS